MSVYRYSGITDQGKDIQGIIDAETPKNARIKLRQSGIFPVELSEGATGSRSSIKKEGSPFLSHYGPLILPLFRCLPNNVLFF